MSTVDELLEIAKAEIKHLISGEIFLVKDLFKGYEWKRLPIKNRRTLGKLFFNYIEANNEKITPIGKTSLGQQKYKIIL